VADQSWGEGYVVDVDYTHGYYRELSPSLLSFVGLLGSVQSIDITQPFTYYELGCGNGRSLLVHAVANPSGQFIGVDFNPAHIHTARNLARELGVKNVSFLEKSFAELLELDTADAHIIALHGVWSWINEDNRTQITAFTRKRLLPGGLLYVSYNALPGSAQVAPLQRLLLDQSRSGGDLATQVARSIEFAQTLEKAGAKYFQMNPVAKARLNSFAKQDARYLAHEYFNENWVPFYHADVARDLKSAKLAYVGSSDIIDNFDTFILPPDLARMAADSGDRIASETIKDYARNQNFRRDVFARGAPKATPAQLADLLEHSRFCLARPRSACKLKLQTPAGEFGFNGDAYPRLLDALARAPMTFANLRHAPETAGMEPLALRQTLFTMAAAGNVLPALPAAGEADRRVETDRHNRAAIKGLKADETFVLLASPVSGVGIRIGAIDAQLMLGPKNERAAAEHFLTNLRNRGQKLVWNGKAAETDADICAAIDGQVRPFFLTLLPWLRVIGIAS